MIINCTKKVLDNTKAKKAEKSTISDTSDYKERAFSWHANLITCNRRKVLFFVNDLFGLTVIYYRPKKQDYNRLATILREGIKHLFCTIGIKDDVANRYLDDSIEDIICSTSNRSAISRMNQIGRAIENRAYDFSEEVGFKAIDMYQLSDFVIGEKGKFYSPNERLIETLMKMYDYDTEDGVINRRSYRLKIKLDLDKYDIWRSVGVPATMSFHSLHRVIQTVFDWQDYHLHCFDVLEGNPNDSKPIYFRKKRLHIYDGMDADALEYMFDADYPLVDDFRILLMDVLDEYNWCTYEYDFGDSWIHVITVEDVITTGGSKLPILIDGLGDRPPEDVGGEGGFDEYNRIINDPNDPDHDELISWSELTGPRKRTIEEINLELRRMVII